MFCKVILSILILEDLLWENVTSDPPNFPACNGGVNINDGYTYVIDKISKQRVWTACHFPHPMYDHVTCGMTYIKGKPRYLCDPDQLLSHDTVSGLEMSLEELHRTPATSGSLEEESFMTKQKLQVWLVLVNHIQVIDLQALTRCENGCGQIQPVVVTSERNASAEEVDTTIEHYSNVMRQSFSDTNSKNSVLIFYTDAYKKAWVSVGEGVDSFIPNHVIETIKTQLPQALQSNNFTHFSESILNIRTTFGHVGITPAGVMLSLGIITALFVVFIQVLFLYLKPKVFPVWEESIGYQAIGAVLYYGLGIWIYEYMFLGIFFISERVSVWFLVLPVIAMAASFSLYFLGYSSIVRY